MPFLRFLCQYLHITVLAYLFEGYLPSKTACQNPQEYSAVSNAPRPQKFQIQAETVSDSQEDSHLHVQEFRGLSVLEKDNP
jgi:hypothetical protein